MISAKELRKTTKSPYDATMKAIEELVVSKNERGKRYATYGPVPKDLAEDLMDDLVHEGYKVILKDIFGYLKDLSISWEKE